MVVELHGKWATMRTLRISKPRSFGPIPLKSPESLTGRFSIGSDGAIHCLLALLAQTPQQAWWPVSMDARPIEGTPSVLVLRLLTRASTANSRRVAPILRVIYMAASQPDPLR
jgi:hypothetical protein